SPHRLTPKPSFASGFSPHYPREVLRNPRCARGEIRETTSAIKQAAVVSGRPMYSVWSRMPAWLHVPHRLRASDVEITARGLVEVLGRHRASGSPATVQPNPIDRTY